MSNYIYLGSKSYCTDHPIYECPDGVPPYPTRVKQHWYQRLWLAMKGY